MKRRKILRVLMMFLVLLNATMVFAVSDKIPVPPDQTNEETCNLENLSFSSQAAIDAFGVTYSGCTEITLSGDLTIGFSNDIINLDGLSNLTSVGGNFYIEQASNLTNLVGLNNLTSVGGFLQIRENPNLINLNGLNSLTTVGGYLAIGNNPDLISLDGLSNLTSINGELLSIYQNLSLTNLDGLSNLTSLGGDLSFEGNLSLTNLDGLSNLSSIGGALYITNHSNLTDISGLENITGITVLQIFNNPMLSACNIASFCNYNSSALIFGNLPSCNSLANIHASCVDCQSVTEVSAVPGATTAQISWTANSSETQWEIVWGTVGFDYENATPQIVSGTPEFTIENLVSGATYEVYVKAVCNEFSESGWSEAHVFTTCPSGDYTFTTQAEIDAFGVTYSGCTGITLGNVYISGGDITNLNGLSGITTVTGYFKIAGSSLQNLNGLNNLQSIGGFLEFFDNASLQNLNGLNALTSVGDYLNIYGNSALTNTEALASLNHIGNYLTIYNNHQLTNINGLSSVQHLSGYLYVGYNAVLHNLSGLSNLQTVGSLNIVSNPALSNIGLNALQTTGPLDINSNPALMNLDGLSGLQNVLGHLKIINNATLSDISGLENIVQITGGMDGLHIINNPMLAACDIPSFCSYNLYSEISGNLPSCNSLTNIHASCVDCQSVTEVTAIPAATTAQISWTANSSETQWEIVWGTVGFDYENATPQIVSETPGFTIENLISGTAYEVYVKAICNEFSESEWSVVSNFTTLCPSGDYTFTTQIEIDAFGVTYSGCTDIILGQVVISGSDIANLNGLSNLKTTGSLEIQSNPALTNLDGLSGLQNVLGHLKIINNATLSDISGLENIVQITGGMDGLHIINNPMLAVCDVPPFCSYNLYSDMSGNLPSCNSLANIHASCVDCQSVTEVTAVPGATTAQISWTAKSSETQWEIVWGTVGFDYENATPQTVSGTPGFTIENLIQGTTYEVYVKAVCNEFSESGWSEAHVFTICPSGDYTFTTQAEIDAFGVTYSGCTDIVLGNLTISGGEINDLNGLSGIVTVTGNLTINHTSLVNLQGLNNLESVGGIFAFHDNGLFDDFTGLNNLESIGMGFPVYGNGNVSGTFEDFNGLDSLVSIGEGFYVAYNHYLKNFEGLTQLNSIGGALYIQYNDNPGFVNLRGLESLQTVSQDVVIEHQHQLQSLQGLDGLTTIGRDLNIRNCQGLQEFNGLNALQSIARDCNIYSNGSLQSINGLEGLQIINGSLNVYSNAALQEFNGFDGLHTINGNLNIYSNPVLQSLNGLNSLETINGFLSIYDHAALQQPDGLEGLSAVGSFVNIIANPQLLNLDGLINLQSIGGALTIDNNNALTDISGLENITVFGTGLNITNNSNLSVCNLLNFCIYLSDASNPRNISGNAGDCVSNAMVLTVCSGSTCLPALSLGYTQLSTTSAELWWTSSGSLFDLEWGATDFVQGTGTMVTDIPTTSYELTGLTENTAYEFYVRQDCGETDGESLWTGPYSFIVGYCVPNPTNSNSANDGDYIHSFITAGGVTNINNTDSGYSVNGYGNFSATHSASVYQGQNLSFSVVPGSSAFNRGLRVWIDWDSDGVFGNSEIVYTSPTTQSGAHNGSFQIPNDQPEGNYRMRVFLKYGTTNINSCNNDSTAGYGEVEDYTLTVLTDLSGNCESFTIWNGTSWSNGTPDANKRMIIEGNLTLTEDLTACELLLNSGVLTVSPGVTLTVNGMIENTQTEADFIVHSDANLIQVEDVENSGSITVHRNSTPMMRLDYALWSSPVDGQGIHAFSPQTVASRIYTYEGQDGYQLVENLSADFEAGKGYMFRAPNNWNQTTDANDGNPVAYPGEFTGVPFNGDISIDIHPMSYTSVGNPYPSNIRLGDNPGHTGNDTFLNANPEVSTIYFWTNTYEADGNGGYLGNNWATYTFMGGTSAGLGSGGTTPVPFVAPGQGFIIRSVGDATAINFNNSMRVSNPALFFKGEGEEDRHRFWLNLRGGNSKNYNQLLIGYMQGATTGIDHQIDGKMFGYEGPALYNLIGEEAFVIQGRPLPFEISDMVPLGFKTETGGKYAVSLSGYEGLFAEGSVSIYIKDNLLGLTHNLLESDYEFESAAGEFTERFEVVYEEESTMGTTDLYTNRVQIYTDREYIVVDSKKEKILSVELYDLSGRNLFREEEVNKNHYRVKSDHLGAQILVVKVQTAEGTVTTKKLVN